MISGSLVKTIDTSTNTLDSQSLFDETFPSGTTGIGLTPDEQQVWVEHSNPNHFVNRIRTDGSDGGEPPLTNLSEGAGPSAIAFTPDGSRAYVAGVGYFRSTSLGGDLRDDRTAAHAKAIAITPDGSHAWVPVADNTPDIYTVDLATNTVNPSTITLPDGPNWLTAAAATPDGSRVYVAGGLQPDPGKVVGISTATREPVGAPIDVGVLPAALAIVPDQSPTSRLDGPRRQSPACR